MNDTPNNMTPDDWRDRLVDRALEEHLGGDAPPDRSASILAAAEEDMNSSQGDLTMATTKNTRSFRGWILAASLLVNCALVAVLASSPGGKPDVAETNGGVEPSVAVETPELDLVKANSPSSPEDEQNGEQADFNSLIDMIQSTTESETWVKEGDKAEFPSNIVLSQEQSQEVSEQASSRTAGRKQETGPKIIKAKGSQSMNDVAKNQARGRVRGGRVLASKLTEEAEELPAANAPVEIRATPTPKFPMAERFEEYDSLESTLVSEEERKRLQNFSISRATQMKDMRLGSASARDDKQSLIKRVEGLNRQLGDLGGDEERAKRIDNYELAYQMQTGKTPLYASLDAKRRFSYRGEDGGFQYDPSGEWQGSPDGEGRGPGASGDRYERIHENPFMAAIGGDAISTFSIDVDTASYANVRQMLANGQQPPADAVRIEELVNYFDYNYEPPSGGILNQSSESSVEEATATDSEDADGDTYSVEASNGGFKFKGSDSSAKQTPFAAHVETAACPWQPNHRLVRVGIKGRVIPEEKRPVSNLVFLVDVSGSMNNPEKLPLVKHGLMKLAEKLGENDRVAIVVYASSEGLALPSTPGTEQETILAALSNLNAGGSTAGGAGIRLAYQIAEDNFIEGGTNRVILCTDGDFNVGTTNTAELERLVEKKAKDTKVFLSCIGFGRGNLNDQMMEKITGIGNGNYYYADSEQEAERIFVKGMTGMLVTIAKDVKIQIEFNPAKVAGYRLLGYENRMLKTQDFNDDKKDAGEIGAGHTVTCLYEIVPAGKPIDTPDIDELKYQRPAGLSKAADTDEMLTLKMRYKQPNEDVSTKLEWPVSDSGNAFGQATTDFQFAASVASFGMLLRDSQHKGMSNYDAVIEIAQSAIGDDPSGDRAQFVDIVRAAKKVMPEPTTTQDEDQGEEVAEESGDGETLEGEAPADGESESTTEEADGASSEEEPTE